jgi:hypothetical protein
MIVVDAHLSQISWCERVHECGDSIDYLQDLYTNWTGDTVRAKRTLIGANEGVYMGRTGRYRNMPAMVFDQKSIIT